ncbi:MAG: DAK2 domain-containing protein [Lachnospiraceae bacterium]|nr:DAK2 domain-containing protein [Lachnospiraceae bacterium]
MEVREIDALTFRKMFVTGARCLEIQKNYINDLNVFPVPDGDTGTNMSLTITTAAETVSNLENPSVEEVAKAISSGSLRGARGNSGVILSQLFRGFYKGLKDQTSLTAPIISAAMTKATETAYKAVMKPKEGTILTVAKALSDRAAELCYNEMPLGDFMEAILAAGDSTLARTPEMLPVLKEAGVVDAGGQGLMTILHGAVDAFYGREPEEVHVEMAEAVSYPYKAEIVVITDAVMSDRERQVLSNLLDTVGDEVEIAVGGTCVRVSMVTDEPGIVIEKLMTVGELAASRVRNMTIPEGAAAFAVDEAEAPVKEEKAKEPAKPYAFIAVASGDGMAEIFANCGVEKVIKGGQTMNPSTEDFLNAIEEVNAEVVYILPNNKNIILAASQAADLSKDCRVAVIPTKTIPQGLTAVINYVPDRSVEENVAAMTEEIGRVKTGQVTYAVRDTSIDGKEIHVGDMMGINDDGIAAVGQDIKAVCLDMLKAMVDEDAELISIYNGEDLSSEDAEELQGMVEEAFPDCDVELNYGGQAVYYCIVSVE